MAGIDHLVIGCDTLEQGAAWAAEVLGIDAPPGGAHPGWGTHNRLAGLGPDVYLELIATDPAQPAPARPLPFGLEDPALRERLRRSPALLTYVARCDDLNALAARLGEGTEAPARMSRGALSWWLARPADSMGGIVPSLIEWPDGVSVAARLADSGLRLLRLEAEHPRPDVPRAALAARGLAVEVRQGPVARLLGHLRRPDGTVVVLESS